MPVGVMAVVVSFNGEAKTVQTVEALIPQVDRVYIVDNGSGSSSRALLSALAGYPGVTVEWLDRNCGIAAALNRGIHQAQAEGAHWVLTMDQDSCLSPGAVSKLLECARAADSAAVVTAATEATCDTGRPAVSKVPFAITSGNLVPVHVYQLVGCYEEALFIDGVDIDFSLRLSDAGVQILRVASAEMNHRLGDAGDWGPVRHGLGRFYSLHSPRRRYYLVRNHFWLVRRHGGRHPGFMLKLSMALLLSLLSLLIYGPERRACFVNVARGVVDGCRGRLGAYEDNWAIAP